MRDVKRAMDLALGVNERLPTVELGAVFSQRLFGFLKGCEYNRVEGGESSSLRGFGLPYAPSPCATDAICFLG
jgi:hypothetical protein